MAGDDSAWSDSIRKPVCPLTPISADAGPENPFALMTSFEGVAKLLGTRSAVLPAW